MCLLKTEMSSCLRGKAQETQHEHLLFVMALVWQLCPWPAEGLGDWTSPFCAPVSFSHIHIKDIIWDWAHLENHNLPVPCTTQFITHFFLQPASTQLLISRQKEMFHTCKSSYLTALVLPEQRWNHTQTPCSEDGWENSCPISIPEATQGTGNPIWPPCTANSDFFKGLGDVGTQLLIHEPSSPWALLTGSDLVNCIFLKYENVWEGTVRTFKNCSTLILINRVDWKQNM